MAFEALVAEVRPDVVVVVGDVNSTPRRRFVGAKAACLVAHVEAGLRSRDWAMPEEINRVVTDRAERLPARPSADGVDNLQGRGYRDDQIHLVGSVMVDSLLATLARARARPVLQELGLTPEGYGLVRSTGPPTSTTRTCCEAWSTPWARSPPSGRSCYRLTPHPAADGDHARA